MFQNQLVPSVGPPDVFEVFHSIDSVDDESMDTLNVIGLENTLADDGFEYHYVYFLQEDHDVGVACQKVVGRLDRAFVLEQVEQRSRYENPQAGRPDSVDEFSEGVRVAGWTVDVVAEQVQLECRQQKQIHDSRYLQVGSE